MCVGVGVRELSNRHTQQERKAEAEIRNVEYSRQNCAKRRARLDDGQRVARNVERVRVRVRAVEEPLDEDARTQRLHDAPEAERHRVPVRVHTRARPEHTHTASVQFSSVHLGLRSGLCERGGNVL